MMNALEEKAGCKQHPDRVWSGGYGILYWVVSSSVKGKINLPEKRPVTPAGHSVRVPPGLIPNPEVKPHVAVILVRCVSPREVAVLAPFD
jgi:hypothetical protein